MSYDTSKYLALVLIGLFPSLGGCLQHLAVKADVEASAAEPMDPRETADEEDDDRKVNEFFE